ncbi:HNH endonuclease [Paenibacillus barcinonensis]|uniref:HNH endonuclease n=1 Tax=Paenibacillus barcinonensis TaxID=198119 RepID=A0A2V4VXA8_PAEBA|nr:HNH endonuclease [Paenibacillus barcinonensis]PYE49828.1 HNH endonuclease [Paenibacillus barcinonensis]QKS56497.1 HNH endonuclease [Paenibacillus barcinonensis]
MTESISIELARRDSMWNRLVSENDPNNVEPGILRGLRFFSGQAGIYRDATTTQSYTEDNAGIAVSILHTGRHYPDEVSENEIIYHYPVTKRHSSFDKNEIQSAKNASIFNLPIFVISEVGKMRKVQLGKVVSWDDLAQNFLIELNPLDFSTQPNELDHLDDIPFKPTVPRAPSRTVTVSNRAGQPRFKFNVVKRYGPCCAVCAMQALPLLQAAHIIPKKSNGSDDPRNGLVLCGNHHLAYDSGLFSFDPDTLKIHVSTKTTMQSIQITRQDLSHLQKLPHDKALKWHWKQWQAAQKELE